MQYNHILTLNKIRKSRTFSIVLKLFIFMVVSVYLFFVVSKKDFDLSFKQAFLNGFRNHPFLISLSLILIIFNWSLEAWKWQYLGNKLEKISFLKALRGVIAGVALSFVTPLGLGDYAGRILNLNHSDRSRSLGAVFLCRVLQLYITLIFGLSSLLFMPHSLNRNIYYISIFLFLGLTVALLFYRYLIRFIGSVSYLNKIHPYISIISEYKPSEIYYVLMISFVRYLVFTMQFILLLVIFEVQAPLFILFAGVSFIFIVKSIIPTMFDLGVREGAAILFFGSYSLAENILVASLSLWVINLLVPAVVGMFLIFKLKIFPQS